MSRCLRASAFTPVVIFWSTVALIAATSEPRRNQAILEIQQFIDNGDLARARSLLQMSARKFPRDAGFDNLLGVIDAQEGQYHAAAIDFQRAIQRDPNLTAAYLNLGRLFQEHFTSDPKLQGRALALYQKVLTYDVRNAEANYQSATLLVRNGRFQQSLTHLLRLPNDTQQNAQTLSLLCAAYAGLGDRRSADQVFVRLIAAPDFSQADLRQMLSGLAAGKRNDLLIGAAETLGKREELASDLQHSLALAYEASGRLAEARSIFELLATHGHLSVAALMELARVAHQQKDYQGSLGYLAHARDLEPDSASIHYSFGLVCLDLDLLAEARNSFEKAVGLQPENPSYNYMMGVTSVFRRDPAEAVPYLEKYLALKPRDPHGQLALGVAHFRAKDYDSALPWFTKAEASSATASTAHYYLGALAIQQDRLQEAHKQLELAIQAHAEYADALAELGHYYLLTKQYAQAETYLNSALRADPNHLSANFYLLTLFARIGDPRREKQAKHYDDLEKLQEQRSLEVMRLVEVQPFDSSQP